MLRRWKKEVLTTELMCALNERVESKRTPRFRTRGEGDRVTLSMEREKGEVLERVDLDPVRISSVLSLFNMRKLCFIHVLISVMQFSSWVRGGFLID